MSATAEIIVLRRGGHTLREISAAVGVSFQRVGQVLDSLPPAQRVSVESDYRERHAPKHGGGRKAGPAKAQLSFRVSKRADREFKRLCRERGLSGGALIEQLLENAGNNTA